MKNPDLSRIGTRPEYQGQGAATALMKWGMDQADLDGRYCALSADPDVSLELPYFALGTMWQSDTQIAIGIPNL
jgi:GNAT superfamily N-acetyltransferase